MVSKKIRIGIIGAGANTRLRHIPGLRAIDGVEIVGVVNRTPQSTARVRRSLTSRASSATGGSWWMPPISTPS